MNQVKIFGEETVFGLDIGTRSVVGTIGYKQGERFVVVAQEIREHQTRAMLDGQIHDINRVAATIAEIKAALEEKTGLNLQEVCIAAAGRVLKTMNVHVETDFDKERNVTKEDLNTLISMGVEKAFSQFQQENDSNLHFYCVGYSVVKYFINGLWMGQPEHHKAKNIGADMIATFLPDDVVDGLYSAVELAGLKVANMTLEPIAAIRVAIPERFRLLNIAMIDVGAGTSDISITNDGSVTAFGMIPCAGDALTETLARTCLIDFATAEKIKIEAAERNEITYEDIMGIEQTITSDEVVAICQQEIDRMAKLAADEIKRLNGGNSTSAVFIVGGGGKIKGFSDKIAEELGLDPKRVALRGEEIMKDVDFPEGCKKDSTIITPIGICLSYYEQNNNFIYVTFNGNRIKLYDNNKLAVVDAAIQASFNQEGLFPRRGKEIHYTVNGKNRVTRGDYGESARIFVNGESVNLNHAIKANDDIVMEEATEGQEAVVTIADLVDYNARIGIVVNGEAVQLTKPIKVNGREETEEYRIQDDDIVSLYAYYTYEQICRCLQIIPDNTTLLINGEQADKNAVVYAGDILEIQSKEVEQAINEVAPENMQETAGTAQQEKTADVQETSTKQESVHVFKDMIQQAAKDEKKEETVSDTESKRIVVIANKKPVVMEGKESYQFVDIFDYINFDTHKMQGNGIVTLVNGKNAQYTQQLHNGDKIEVFWK